MFGSKSEDDNEENKPSINRRRFVKALGVAGTTSAFGLGTTAAASPFSSDAEADEAPSVAEIKEHDQRIQQQYGSMSAIQGAIDDLGSDYLEQLEKERFLKNTLRDELETMELTTREQMWDVGEGVTVDMWPDLANPQPDINIHKQVGDDLLSIHILPEQDRSYALLNPAINAKNNDECSMTTIVQTEDGLTAQAGDDVGAQACQCTYQCHGFPPCQITGSYTEFTAYCVTVCSDGSCSLEVIRCCNAVLDCNRTKVCNCGCATGNC